MEKNKKKGERANMRRNLPYWSTGVERIKTTEGEDIDTTTTVMAEDSKRMRVHAWEGIHK